MASLDVFKGQTVVDLGCNAGIVTREIAKYAAGYIGVEKNQNAYEQALETQSYITGCPGQFLKMRVKRFLLRSKEYSFDAAYAACLLYHLTSEELCLVEKLLLPRCKVVVFCSRESKRGRDPAKNLGKLYKGYRIEELLRYNGFTTQIVNKDSNWASVIGTK